MDLCKSTSLLGANHTPKVSVIVPVYKVEKYLPECIESVLAQTFTDFELILVDDGSPDNSGKICDDYAARDSRIRVFHKENGGVTSARRLGVENSQGEWIMFVDGDDYLFPKALDVLVVEIRDDVDLIEGSCVRSRTHDDCSTGPGSQNFLCEISGLEYAIEVASHKMVWLPGPVAKIIRKSVLISANALDIPAWINFGEDLMMCLRASFRIRIAKKKSAIVYFYRRNTVGACATIRRSASYYVRWLQECENSVFPGLKGKEARAWRAVANRYFPAMILSCDDWDARDSYARKIVRCLFSNLRECTMNTRVCVLVAMLPEKGFVFCKTVIVSVINLKAWIIQSVCK